MVPQELVDAIVGAVKDFASLKACSLAAPSLLVPSQRILLRSLTLQSGHETMDPSNYSEAHTLLTKSPHIAEYVKNLEIRLPAQQKPLEDVEILQRVLAKLEKVQHLTIGVNYIRGVHWSRLTPELSSSIISFVTQQKLRSLTVSGLEEIPDDVILRLITSTPRLSFSFLCGGRGVDARSFDDLAHPPSIDCLILNNSSEYVFKLLSLPQCTALTRKLTRLSALPKHSMPFISRSARTLKIIRLGCDRTSSGTRKQGCN